MQHLEMLMQQWTEVFGGGDGEYWDSDDARLRTPLSMLRALQSQEQQIDELTAQLAAAKAVRSRRRIPEWYSRSPTTGATHCAAGCSRGGDELQAHDEGAPPGAPRGVGEGGASTRGVGRGASRGGRGADRRSEQRPQRAGAGGAAPPAATGRREVRGSRCRLAAGAPARGVPRDACEAAGPSLRAHAVRAAVHLEAVWGSSGREVCVACGRKRSSRLTFRGGQGGEAPRGWPRDERAARSDAGWDSHLTHIPRVRDARRHTRPRRRVRGPCAVGEAHAVRGQGVAGQSDSKIRSRIFGR